jgi:hypothetical protein
MGDAQRYLWVDNQGMARRRQRAGHAAPLVASKMLVRWAFTAPGTACYRLDVAAGVMFWFRWKTLSGS